MARVLPLQLYFRARNHRRWNLAFKYLGLDPHVSVQKSAVTWTHGRDMVLDTKNPLHVQPAFVTRALQHLYEAFGWIVPPTEGQRTDRCVHHVAACLDALHQIVLDLRFKQTGHVPNAD